MEKTKDKKKKLKLAEKEANKMFKYRVLFTKKTRLPELADDDSTLVAELNAICAAGLVADMYALADIVREVQAELGIGQEVERNTLNGSLVPYILGITDVNPLEQGAQQLDLAKAIEAKLPLQVIVYYDNEVRNKVVDWVKTRYNVVSSRLYVPILKLGKMVVEFNRVVKKRKIIMAQMALGYGSEYQLLRYLGHHRNFLNGQICKVIGAGEIKWLDYPVDNKRDSRDGELKGVECFKSLDNYDSILRQWKEYWPQSGNAHNWDGIFIQNGIWYFVEAKAHLDEANQFCSARSDTSIETIITAFEKTCGNRILAKKWQSSDCYQLANRLAFIYFCKMVGIEARLLYISFINGYESNPALNVTDRKLWYDKIDEEMSCLELTSENKSNIYHLVVDCHEPTT